MSPDNNDPWRQLTEGIPPLPAKPRLPPQPPLAPLRRPGAPYDRLRQDLESLAAPETPPAFVPLDRRAARRLSKTALPPEARLDLHDMNAAEAQKRLEHFLPVAATQGQRTLLVITGKGRSGEGILKKALPDWLALPHLRPLIASYSTAPIALGGEGAYVIRLKNL